MKNEKELQTEKVLDESDGTVQTALDPSSIVHPVNSTDTDVLEDAEEIHNQLDYTTLNKQEFVDLSAELVKDTNFKRVDAVIKDIKPLFDEIKEKERISALDKYKEETGTAEGFEFRGDNLDQAFYANLKLIRDRRQQHFRSLEDQKSDNLKKRHDILEKIRAIVDAEDSEHSFHEFKRLQQEWKNIGPIALAQVKTLWATYSALVDRFYDQRSIYFELKELDRKKNLTTKNELCEKAEKLIHAPKMKDAIRELNELHEEFKHVGPVPKSESDGLWQRFKAASDAIYAMRDAYLAGLQHELQKNLDEKLRLSEELKLFASFQTDRIKEWNQKTQEILEIQKKWEARGAVPRTQAKDINKKFWSAFKAFFANKNIFFKKLDEERDKNLEAKNDLIKRALALQDSSDWNKTANDLKELQRLWKETGPVPEKYREKLFQEFKQACDHFFDQRRGQFEKSDREQDGNLAAKEALCTELEQMAELKSGSLEKLAQIRNQFNALGFVPKKAITSIKVRFNHAVEKYLGSLDVSADERERALLEVQLGSLKDDPDAERKLYNKEQAIRKKISKAENDLAVLQNNLEFFGRSKNAEKLKEEFNAKIAIAAEEVKALKSQLKLLRSVPH